MKFRLEISLCDEDYYAYNEFCIIRSHYGKKQMLTYRILLSLIILLFPISSLLYSGVNFEFVVSAVVYAILIILLNIFFNKIFARSVRSVVKKQKKTGKMAYSQSAVMEFYDDKFTEETELSRGEQSYSVLERISYIESEKLLYLHINSAQSYIIPYSIFDSDEEALAFFEFISSKCNVIDRYK